MVYVAPVIEETLPILEIILPDGTVGKFGAQDAFPKPGVPFRWREKRYKGIEEVQAGWDEVYQFVSDAFDPGSAPATLSMPAVIKAFQAPMERQLQAYGTYINLLQDFVIAMGERTLANDTRLKRSLNTLNALTHRIDHTQNATLRAITRLALPNLQAQIIQARKFAYQLSLNTIHAMKVWTYESIFVPLAKDVAAEQVQRQAADNKIITQDIPAVHADLLAKLAPVAAAATAALNLARQTAKWVDDCGVPMCDTVGPKTDVGKWLKRLNIAASAALLAEIASWDEGDVERLIKSLGTIGNGVIEDIDHMFFNGGHSIGHTLASAVT